MKTVLKILNAPEKTSDPLLAILLANLAGLVAQVESVIKRTTIINRDDSERRQWTAKFSAEPQPHLDCSFERNPRESGGNDGIFEGISVNSLPSTGSHDDRLAIEIVRTLYPDFWPWGSLGEPESMSVAA